MGSDTQQRAILEYGRPEGNLRQWLRRLPRPSKWTGLLLILAIPAVLWLRADHQPWVVERTFPQINSNGRLLTCDDKYLLIGTKRASDPQMLIGPLEVYDIATGKRVSHFGESVWANDSAFSPDGERLVTRGGTYRTLNQHGDIHSLGEWSGGPKNVRLWDLQTGDQIAEFGPGTYAWSDTLNLSKQIHFSPDRQRLLILSGEGAMLYDGRNGAPIAPLEQRDDRKENEHRQVIGDRAWFSPDSRFVVVKMRDPNCVRVWSAADGKLISEFMPIHSDGGEIDGTFSPDSANFDFVDDGWLYLIDPTTAVLRFPPIELGEAYGIWFSPDSRTAVVWHETSTGKMLSAVDAGSGAITASMPQSGSPSISHYFWLSDLRWSPDGRQAVLISRTHSLQVRGSNALQPTTTLRNRTPTLSFNFFSPDGSRALAITHRLEIISTDDWRVTSVIPHKDHPWILDAKFIGDTTRILTARQNGEVELWRLRRPEAVWGVIALPQFWMAAVAILAFAVSAGRDLWRWARRSTGWQLHRRSSAPRRRVVFQLPISAAAAALAAKCFLASPTR